MGRFGLVTDQTLRVAAMVKESGELTNAGIFHTTIISHPTEGFVVCGEEEMAGKVMQIMEEGRLREWVNKAQMRAGGKLNQFDSRQVKERLLMELYDCALPVFPLPPSEMTSLLLLQQQFGKVRESEMAGLRFKKGDEMPQKWREWFPFDEEIFHCIRGATPTKELKGLVEGKGLTLTEFYKTLLHDVYKLRLGVDLWEEYHLERSMEELRMLLQRKNSAREEVRKYLRRNSNYVFFDIVYLDIFR